MKTPITPGAVLVAVAASTAHAQMPQMGGAMKHIMVHWDGSVLTGHVDTTVPTPDLKNYGETYMGNAAALNGTWYNAQYGWIKDGAWSPPSESLLWLERVSASPGLMVLKGGRMSTMASHTFEPIFGTSGSPSRLAWDGTMLHNWYSTPAPGSTYESTYRIYFGDSTGTPLGGYDAAEVTLTWNAVPAPSVGAAFALSGLLTLRRRRA